jgi:hypothetical protein
MKNLLLSFALAFFSLTLFAQQVITVSNRSGENAMFNNLQAAIDAATPGDTIYISGSENNYGGITVNKELHLIGPGFKPEKDFSLQARLDNIEINADASNSSFFGLVFSFIRDNQWASGIRILNCDFSQLFTGASFPNLVSKEWLIGNNIIRSAMFGSGSSQGTNQFIIRNNIFGFDCCSSSINGFHESIISNNVFTTYQAFGGINLSVIYNNIFYGGSPFGATNSVFSNNITFQTNNDALPYDNNTGATNFEGVDPQFADVPVAPGNIFGFNFSYDWDFSLTESSPGKNLGTDGTDIGLFGGLGFTPGGEPALPVVTSFTIINAVINPNGKLNIQVEGRANN